jgi:hypothetical protein
MILDKKTQSLCQNPSLKLAASNFLVAEIAELNCIKWDKTRENRFDLLYILQLMSSCYFGIDGNAIQGANAIQKRPYE